MRQRVQGYIQDLLEEEVTELLGRAKSQRRPARLPESGKAAGFDGSEAGVREGSLASRSRLGADGDVLPLPKGALEASADDPRGGSRPLPPFDSARRRPSATSKVPHATAVIWKTLRIAEKRFRKLHAPHLMKEVYQGTRYVDGVRVSTHKNRKPAA